MRLMRLGEPGAERPAVSTANGQCFDLSGLTDEIDGAFLAFDGIGGSQTQICAEA